MDRGCVSVIPWLAFALPAIVACEQPGPTPGEDGIGLTDDGPAVWPYWPATMRVHPATGLTTDYESGEPYLEVRIEFRDRDDHTTRCFGELALTLIESGGDPERDFLERWRIDLADLERNNTQYDEVTLTYLFRLEIDPAALPDAADLHVRFDSADGRTLLAERAVELADGR